MEKYLQIQWGENIVFRDSLQFFFSSLEALATSLTISKRENFKHLHHVVGEWYLNATVELVERKGVFCYNYLDSFAHLDDQMLPTREQFYSRLSNAECTPEDYAHAQRVWTAFGCKTLACYMKLNLLTDICILADVRNLSNKFTERVQARSRVLPECSTAGLERHTQVYPAAYSPDNGNRDVPNDPAKRARRNLSRERQLCSRKQQTARFAIRPNEAHLIHSIRRRKQTLWVGTEPADGR